MTGYETTNDIDLVQTCFACPEQYDAFIGDTYVGYLRLRHGYFGVDNRHGTEIYSANPSGDGIFEVEEREHYLMEAKRAIINSIQDEIAGQ